jgi:deoxyribodipyrimidine photolyase-related protein
MDIRPDRHFMCSTKDFADHASSRKRLLMEHFYRGMRRKTCILMKHGKPTGGTWNLDRQNRKSFSGKGPGTVPAPTSFRPDATTQQVIAVVKKTFEEHPGSVENFDWPVTVRQAKKALDDFVRKRLPLFGPYQDAMWDGQPYLYHSRLSAALNLKLLQPRDVIAAALRALDTGTAPLNSVEGFIRQILGWREYVRGIYWHFMPEYADRNELEAGSPLPWFYWTAETDMNCLHTCVAQTLDYGYAHHIQRLMVTGLFALLLGVEPKEIHKWYLAIYVDAVEWVELPNTIGMSQFADGGVMATKPYAASGAYINRMSNYCETCRYEPLRRSGDMACPFTTLYWDFLMRNEERLNRIPRMGMQLRNLKRLDRKERLSIRRHADVVRKQATGYTETAGKK